MWQIEEIKSDIEKTKANLERMAVAYPSKNMNIAIKQAEITLHELEMHNLPNIEKAATI